MEVDSKSPSLQGSAPASMTEQKYLVDEVADAVDHCPITTKPYIPSQKLDTIITAERVRAEVLRSKWNRFRLRFFCPNFDDKINKAKKFIAILALMARLDETSVMFLAVKGLTDDDLPVRVEDNNSLQTKDGRISFRFPNWPDPVVKLFIREQWKVLAHILKFDAQHPVEVSFDRNCGIDFSNCGRIYRTDYSHVYLAEISNKATGQKSVRVAVKKFTQNKSTEEDQTSLKNYKREKENLETINGINNLHLIKQLANCEQVPCIIFPWADRGDLNNFWKEESTSQRTSAVFSWSLEQVIGLASAVRDLHGARCRHGDLKPSNILYFEENGTGTLKIADLGVSKVHAKDTNLRQGITTTTASTRVYEGPEAYRPGVTGAPRSRAYDWWTMGCIILEFVIWLLYDYPALLSFVDERKSEFQGYYRLKPGSDGKSKDWCDDFERDPAVDSAIKLLREDARVKGTMLEELVNLVDEHLLLINPAKRYKAAEVTKELQKLFTQCKSGQMPLVNKASSPPLPEIFRKKARKPEQTTSQGFVNSTIDKGQAQ